MKRINALTVRQSLGQVLDELDRSGPVMVEKGRTPRAVLISIADYRERFVDRVAADERRALAAELLGMRATRSTTDVSVVDQLRQLRGALS